MGRKARGYSTWTMLDSQQLMDELKATQERLSRFGSKTLYIAPLHKALDNLGRAIHGVSLVLTGGKTRMHHGPIAGGSRLPEPEPELVELKPVRRRGPPEKG